MKSCVGDATVASFDAIGVTGAPRHGTVRMLVLLPRTAPLLHSSTCWVILAGNCDPRSEILDLAGPRMCGLPRARRPILSRGRYAWGGHYHYRLAPWYITRHYYHALADGGGRLDPITALSLVHVPANRNPRACCSGLHCTASTFSTRYALPHALPIHSRPRHMALLHLNRVNLLTSDTRASPLTISGRRTWGRLPRCGHCRRNLVRRVPVQPVLWLGVGHLCLW